MYSIAYPHGATVYSAAMFRHCNHVNETRCWILELTRSARASVLTFDGWNGTVSSPVFIYCSVAYPYQLITFVSSWRRRAIGHDVAKIRVMALLADGAPTEAEAKSLTDCINDQENAHRSSKLERFKALRAHAASCNNLTTDFCKIWASCDDTVVKNFSFFVPQVESILYLFINGKNVGSNASHTVYGSITQACTEHINFLGRCFFTAAANWNPRDRVSPFLRCTCDRKPNDAKLWHIEWSTCNNGRR